MCAGKRSPAESPGEGRRERGHGRGIYTINVRDIDVNRACLRSVDNELHAASSANSAV